METLETHALFFKVTYLRRLEPRCGNGIWTKEQPEKFHFQCSVHWTKHCNQWL